MTDELARALEEARRIVADPDKYQAAPGAGARLARALLSQSAAVERLTKELDEVKDDRAEWHDAFVERGIDLDRSKVRADSLADEVRRLREAVPERLAEVLCKSGKFETGQGTCALICMDQLGDARKRGCSHRNEVHAKFIEIARAVLSAPKEE